MVLIGSIDLDVVYEKVINNSCTFQLKKFITTPTRPFFHFQAWDLEPIRGSCDFLPL